MKCVLILVVIVTLSCLGLAWGNDRCRGDCTSSIVCAAQAGDLNCRCSFLKCQMTDPCGGGCVTNEQCSTWSGNPDCVCTRWFECDLKTNLANPGYKPLLKLAEMAKRRKKGFNAADN